VLLLLRFENFNAKLFCDFLFKDSDIAPSGFVSAVNEPRLNNFEAAELRWPGTL
jgi:hypothetical protein